MEFILIAILIGLIPAAIARKKGREFVPWWIYGSLLLIIALPHALIMRPDRDAVDRRRSEDEGRRKCPFCAELVKVEAVVCRYCSRELPAVQPESEPAAWSVSTTSVTKTVQCGCGQAVNESTNRCPRCKTPLQW